MISAFKHIRLSGYDLTPISGQAWDGSSQLRLGFSSSGLAYYSELTGISGYLQSLIQIADANVNSVNGLTGAINITGSDGVTIQVDAGLGQITVVGNSGYFQGLVNTLTSNLNTTGNNLTTYVNATFVAKTSNQVFTTPLTPGADTYSINYPVVFAGIIPPKVQATLEVSGDVMYNLSIKSINTTGYTSLLSDNVLESNVKIHTFASTQ